MTAIPYSQKPMRAMVIYTDGASKGNPGPAGLGMVLLDPAGNVIVDVGENGGITTNNVAEWSAFIRGMELALDHGATHVEMRTDSQLVAKQFTGEYRVKSVELVALITRAKEIAKRFQGITVIHIPREQNRRADAASNRGVYAK